MAICSRNIDCRASHAGRAVRAQAYLMADGVKPIDIVALGTVKGDLHDIGKNLVAMIVESARFAINDLDTDVAGLRDRVMTSRYYERLN